MRILAFSDVHSSAEAVAELGRKVKRAEVLVCAGDFTIFGQDMQAMLAAFNQIGKPVMLVHGNHESPSEVRSMCAKLENVTFVHKKTAVLEGFTFLGHGGGGFAHYDRDFERFAAKLRLRPKTKLIFVTHQPPHNTRLDYIRDHHGSISYRGFIEKARPVLAVCGHLHETQGKEDKIGSTRCINPGPMGRMVVV